MPKRHPWIPGLSALVLALAPSFARAQAPSAIAVDEISSRIEKAFGEQPAITRTETGLRLSSENGTSYAIVGINESDSTLTIAAGPRRINVAESAFTSDKRGALDALAQLLTVAEAHAIPDESLVLRDVLLIGPHLSSGKTWVLPEGALEREDGGVLKGRQVLESAVTQALARIDAAEIGELARNALRTTIKAAGAEDSDDTYVTSPFARRLLEAGFVNQILPGDPVLLTLTETVRTAVSMRPVKLYRGKAGTIQEIGNDVGGSAWTLDLERRKGYAVIAEKPMFHPDPLEFQLVVETTVPWNEVRTPEDVLRATIHCEDRWLATFDRSSAFKSDSKAWDDLARRGVEKGDNLAQGFFPPHVLVSLPNGKVLFLATPAGTLTPPQDDSAAERERFLASAAKLLPDPAHLDLIGEHFFTYCYDSPDPKFPLLVGNDENRGEVHQTVEQTLATCTAGVFRGDCDDLAEVYQEICTRQGRLGHVINVPGHAAFACAEKLKDDTGYLVHVLQTGPPLTFKAKTLPLALELAFKEFGVLEAFDPDQVSIAVRFSGENTRSNWLLSWRIFEDAAYSSTMIDIQRDWHFHTYQRGIKKMLVIVASGDTDAANWRELAGLYESTGQHLLAAEHAAKAIATGGDPTLSVTTRQLLGLYRAGKTKEAAEIARQTFEGELPKLKSKLGPAYLQVAIDFAATVISEGKDHELGARILNETVTSTIQRQVVGVASLINRANFDRKSWIEDPAMMELRSLFQRFVLTAELLLREAGPAQVSKNQALFNAVSTVELWLQSVAFHDHSEPGELMQRYSDAGRYYQFALGEGVFRTMVSETKRPSELPEIGSRRLPGVGQLVLDLPYVNASVSFWIDQLRALFDREKATLDPSRVRDFHDRAIAAGDTSKALGQMSPVDLDQLRLAALINSVVHSDLEGATRAIKSIARENDKFLRDLAAGWLGTMARFVPDDTFRALLAIWHKEVGHKPTYFEIAWTAAANQGGRGARIAADFAAQTFPTDAAFQEERSFLHAVLDAR